MTFRHLKNLAEGHEPSQIVKNSHESSDPLGSELSSTLSSDPSPVTVDSLEPGMRVASPRILALDGIRGLAMILVLVWHFLSCQVRTTPGSSIAYMMKLLSYSWAGVDLFFVLSGFLIGGILLDQRSSPNYFIPFYLRRACRIFPLYYLVYVLFLAGCKYPAWQIGGGGA